jgi:predicted acylesterase/phospholipase RssA
MKESVTQECLDLAELGYCKCLLKQHRYSRINERLSKRHRISSAELWLIYAQAQRNIGDYGGAKFGVQKAMKLEPLNIDIQREEKAIKMKQERIKVYEPLDFSSCSSIRNGEQPFYNILSIDGGGIRGIIPAIWLMLLERKIKAPISSIFHVVAGTSTGAIIGAGLTIPSSDNPSKPRYQACDLVQLYRTKAEKVFTKNSGFLNQIRTSILMQPKYLAEGRNMLFYEYFGGSRLSDTLSELVVPAVKSSSNATDIFTRQGSRQDLTKNVLLTKILMCTTAAPTYFPPYRFEDTAYIDGGVQANNPAMLAYDHTKKIYRNCNGNRIRLLSLGTGDYVPDPLNPDSSRNLLFWARNNQSVLKVLMDGPQNNIDLHLNNILNDNYYRWQIWLENPIELDDIRDTSINKLIDLAHGHLEEMEAYDNRHRLGRLIEDLQSSS